MMDRFRFSLSSILVTVALLGVNLSAIRWGLRLPNLMAKGMIQEIVIGGTPMASLLILGFLLALYGPTRQRLRRPFWIGFGFIGTSALGLFVVGCLAYSEAMNNYVYPTVFQIDAVLRRIGLTWQIGDHGPRYAIVIASIVMLLAFPQIILAAMGGWVAERVRMRSTLRGSRLPDRIG